MDVRKATSVTGVPIRLTDERWNHIVLAHGDMAEMLEMVLSTLEKPERVLLGDEGEFIAIRQLQPNRWLAVVYRISGDDGFVITAYRVSREGYFRQRRQVWP